MLQLDLNPSNFQMQCRVINDILINKRLFLRVYELRKKFRCLIKKVLQKKNIVRRNRSACVEERFHGFDIVRKNSKNEHKENYVAADVVYKPVSRIDQIVNCYFTSSMRNACRPASHLKKVLEITAAEKYYACNKFFVQKKSLECHLKTCSSMAGIIYKFENQGIQTFFDNMKFMSDLPFAIYFDSETTSGKKNLQF